MEIDARDEADAETPELRQLNGDLRKDAEGVAYCDDEQGELRVRLME